MAEPKRQSTVDEQLKATAERFIKDDAAALSCERALEQAQAALAMARAARATTEGELRKHAGPNVPILYILVGEKLVVVREAHATVQECVK